MTAPPCPFCEIVAGRGPASLLHRDATCLALMNVRPVHEGEFVVVPLGHVDHFTDLDDGTATHIIVIAQRLARAAMKITGALCMGYVVHGFGVPHAHLNVIPQHAPDDILSGRHVEAPGGWSIRLPDAPGRAALDGMAARIAAAL